MITRRRNKDSEKPSEMVTKPKNKKTVTNNNTSVRILDDRKRSSKKGENQDVYEFTFDPNEEPAPQKKKKKRVNKKPPKPKNYVFSNNYEKNLSKALAALKNVVHTKKQDNVNVPKSISTCNKTQTVKIKAQNHNSIQIQDIAADFADISEHNEIDYSPVNSPQRASPTKKTPTQILVRNKDPLNLQENLSFFDDLPVANSSMIMSERNPCASPWRADFGHLPIKWQANAHVKPNMTPAVESSFVNFNDSQKKHVYTNIAPNSNQVLQKLQEPELPKLKQTSIISFIKEVVERSAKKQKSGIVAQNNSVFDNISNDNIEDVTNFESPTKTVNNSNLSPIKNSSNSSNESKISSSTQYSVSRKRKIDTENLSPLKVNKRTKVDKENTFFGFDDSKNDDQENIQTKRSSKRLGLHRPKTRAVLQDLNQLTGPSRAVGIKANFISNPDVVETLYNKLKSGNVDNNVFEKKTEKNNDTRNVEEQVSHEDSNDSSDNVHLFEDIDVVHHLKTTRKSYGKAKKLTFQQTVNNDDSNSDDDQLARSDNECEDDKSFRLPCTKEKKIVKKKPLKAKLTKKEQEALEVWAAGFNSMCEDVDEFDLVVE